MIEQEKYIRQILSNIIENYPLSNEDKVGLDWIISLLPSSKEEKVKQIYDLEIEYIVNGWKELGMSFEDFLSIKEERENYDHNSKGYEISKDESIYC